ncbi:MAG: hypothetical protein ACM3SQ_08550 [Betaproteobacteria bacterium]
MDSKNRTTVALVTILLWGAGCSASTDLVSKECRTAVTMPARPVYEPSDSVVDGKPITYHQYRSLQDGITYGFVCAPRTKLMEGKDVDQAFNSVRQGFLIDGDKQLLSEHNVLLKTIQGREFLLKAAAYMMRDRVYLFPDSMVNVWVIGSQADVASAAADRFLDSLRVVAR